MNQQLESTQGEPTFDLVHLCRHFSELSPHPIIVVEGATHIVRYLNTAFAHLAGTRPSQLVGRPIAEAVPEEEKNGCRALFDRVYSTGTPEVLLEQEHSQSPPVYWSYSVWPISATGGKPGGVVIQVTDATEVALFRRRVVEINGELLRSALRQHELTETAERALQNTQTAEQANAAKDEFLARMSHELRTPLNAILGFGQILELQSNTLSSRHNEYVQHILKSGRHLLDLVNEVLDITRIYAPDSALTFEVVNLSELAQEAADMLQPLAFSAGISITQELAAVPSLFVMADRQRLLQILLNLLSNAIKYNRPQGQVTVSIQTLPEHRVRLNISDTGYGIAPEDLSKLFVPFSRLNAEELGVAGTGLGLVLCQRLARAMNGSLGVESQVGQGSTFSVELPVTQTSSEGRTALTPSSTVPLHSVGINVTVRLKTILLIEDNLSNFQLVESALKELDEVRLVGAMQGGLGVELARQQRPDLILLDLHLPDIRGEEVLRHLRAIPETQDVPVIILSADATPSQTDRLLSQGAQQYLTVPLNVKQFLLAVNETINPRQNGVTHG